MLGQVEEQLLFVTSFLASGLNHCGIRLNPKCHICHTPYQIQVLGHIFVSGTLPTTQNQDYFC